MELEVVGRSRVELLEILADFETYEAKYQNSPEWRDDLDFVYPVYGNAWVWPFAPHLDNIKPGGVYRCHKAIAKVSTSPQEHYRFKNELALLALGIPLKRFWQRPPDFEEAPFYPLLHFSDREGVIGTGLAKLLAMDFASYQARASHHPAEWFRAKYRQWQRCCEVAAQDGYLDFD
jgi:hypothetical protein